MGTFIYFTENYNLLCISSTLILSEFSNFAFIITVLYKIETHTPSVRILAKYQTDLKVHQLNKANGPHMKSGGPQHTNIL